MASNSCVVPDDAISNVVSYELKSKLNPHDIVLQIETDDSRTVNVTRRATTDMMRTTIEVSTNPPNIFFKAQAAAKSAAACLSLKLLEHLFPQSDTELNSLDWTTVNPQVANT
jgi:hypothetical protein